MKITPDNGMSYAVMEFDAFVLGETESEDQVRLVAGVLEQAYDQVLEGNKYNNATLPDIETMIRHTQKKLGYTPEV